MAKDGEPVDIRDIERPFSKTICLKDSDAVAINDDFALRFARVFAERRRQTRNLVFVAAPMNVRIVRESLLDTPRKTPYIETEGIGTMRINSSADRSTIFVGDYEITYRYSKAERNQCCFDIKSPNPVTLVALGSSIDMAKYLEETRGFKPSTSA